MIDTGKNLKTISDYIEVLRSMPDMMEGVDDDGSVTVLYVNLVADGLEAAWKREAADIEFNAAPLPAVLIKSAKRIPERNCDRFDTVDEARVEYQKEHIPALTFKDVMNDQEVAFSTRLINVLYGVFAQVFHTNKAEDVRLSDFCRVMTPEKFTARRNCGRRTLHEMEDILSHYGMEMGREYAAPDISFEEWLFAKVKDGGTDAKQRWEYVSRKALVNMKSKKWTDDGN